MKDKQKIISELLPYKDRITTASNWTEFSKQKDLPSVGIIQYVFGSWNEFKKIMGVIESPIKRSNYSKAELIRIASDNIEHFLTRDKWNRFATERGLPRYITYVRTFGSWNQAKDALNAEKSENHGNRRYSKDGIIEVLKEHGSNYRSSAQWNEYAKERGLPYYATIREYLDHSELFKFIESTKTKKFTKEDLEEIKKVHKSIFHKATIKSWNDYASQNNLPSSATFIRMYGSWKEAKKQ